MMVSEELLAAQDSAEPGFSISEWQAQDRDARLKLAEFDSSLSAGALCEIWKAESRSPRIRAALLRHPAASEDLLQLAWAEAQRQSLRSVYGIDYVVCITSSSALTEDLWEEIRDTDSQINGSDPEISQALLRAGWKFERPFPEQATLITRLSPSAQLLALASVYAQLDPSENREPLSALTQTVIRSHGADAARNEMIGQLLGVVERAALAPTKAILDRRLARIYDERELAAVGRDNLVSFCVSALREWRDW